MEMLFQFLSETGPIIAGLLTVPVLQGIKAASGWVDARHPIVKQIMAVIIAYVLTQLGSVLNVALPGDLALFTGSDVEAAVAAAIAFGVHAGQKARQKDSGGTA